MFLMKELGIFDIVMFMCIFSEDTHIEIKKDCKGNRWLVLKRKIINLENISYFYETVRGMTALMLQGRECETVDIGYEDFVKLL